MGTRTTNHNRSSTRPTTTIYGHPGGYARHLARRAFMRCAIGIAGIVGVIWAFWALRGFSTPPREELPLLICTITALAICYIGTRLGFTQYGKAAVGAQSESRVGRVLARSGAAVVLNGSMIGGGGDADHIVLGPPLVVIETKTGYGNVYTRGNELHAGKRRIPGDPIAQVLRQARTLSRQVNTRVTCVVCVVDMVGPPFVSRQVTVCSLADLTNVMSSAPQALTGAQARALGDQIWATNESVLAARKLNPPKKYSLPA
jgi:hypothetical protein